MRQTLIYLFDYRFDKSNIAKDCIMNWIILIIAGFFEAGFIGAKTKEVKECI